MKFSKFKKIIMVYLIVCIAIVHSQAQAFAQKQASTEPAKPFKHDVSAVYDKDSKTMQNYMNVLRDQQKDSKSSALEKFRIQQDPISLDDNFNYFPKHLKIRNLSLTDCDISKVLMIISKRAGKNIVLDKSVKGTLSLELNNVSLNEIMQIVLTSEELEARVSGNTIFVASRSAMTKKGLNRKHIKAFKLNNSNCIEVAQILEASIFNRGYKVKEDSGGSGDTGALMQMAPLPGAPGATAPKMPATTVSQSELLDKKIIKGRVEKLKAGVGFGDASSLASEIKIQEVTHQTEDIEIDNNDGGAIVIPDTRTNSVLVAGLKKDIAIAEQTIEYLDKPLPQIALEVSLIEINKNDLKDRQFPLSVQKGPFAFSFVYNDDQGNNGTFFNMDRGAGMVKSVVTQGHIFSNNANPNPIPTANSFKYLLENNRAKLLANPTILALDGSESIVKITDEIIGKYEITITQTGVTQSVEKEDVGIVLNILPKVGKNGFVTMRIRPSITIPTDNVQLTNGGFITLIQTREVILQDARVRAGATLAIAGLIRDADTEVVRKVPLMGDLPLFGSLFKSKNLTKEKTELIILITPKLVDDKSIS